MAGSVKISQLIEAPTVGPNDSIPIARGGQETFRTPAAQFVTQAVNIGVGPGQLFSLKTASTPTTLQFRTLSAKGENLAIATVGDTVVFEMSGQTPYKKTFTGDGTTTVWPLAPFNSVNAANYRVDIDGVLQEPFADYSLSANHIVFTEAPYLSGKVVIVSSNVVRLNEAIVAPDSIVNNMFTDECVDTAQLSSQSVTTDKIALSAVGINQLATNLDFTNKVITLTGSTIYGGTINTGPSQNTTSGSSFIFTDIPPWAKRITIMLNGVRKNGASRGMIQLGTSSGLQTTSYTSFAIYATNGATGSSQSSAGFIFWMGGGNDINYGHMILTRQTDNTWVQSHSGGFTNLGSTYFMFNGGGSVSLSGPLSQLRFKPETDSDTFSQGSINIMYEG